MRLFLRTETLKYVLWPHWSKITIKHFKSIFFYPKKNLKLYFLWISYMEILPSTITLKHGSDGVELLTLKGLVIMLKNILLS